MNDQFIFDLIRESQRSLLSNDVIFWKIKQPLHDPNVYEVLVDGAIMCIVEHDYWQSWTGRRFLNGSEYHGPIVDAEYLTTYRGKRSCQCETCLLTVKPELRRN